MKSGIEHRPFTMPQGDFPRVIVSPVDVLNPNEHIPNSIVRMNTKALWDTGADFCMISQELARSLRLVGQGYASVNQVEGNDVSRKAYLVNLLLPNGIVFSDVVALEDPGLRRMGVDFLIGLSVINEVDFALTHDRSGATVLSISYPADRLVDFCKDRL